MNEANQTKGVEVDLLVLDYKMCFDSLYTNSVALDLYDSGIQDNLSILYMKLTNLIQLGLTPHAVSLKEWKLTTQSYKGNVWVRLNAVTVWTKLENNVLRMKRTFITIETAQPSRHSGWSMTSFV